MIYIIFLKEQFELAKRRPLTVRAPFLEKYYYIIEM
jgi:hypothetical protein